MLGSCFRRSTKFLISFGSVIVFGSLISGPVINFAADDDPWPNCLRNEPGDQGPFDVKDCNNDPMNVSGDIAVVKTEQMLGLSPQEITFMGCDAAPFEASMPITEPPAHFRILYKSKSGAGSNYYIAPILHEIGHVYQLKQTGSPQNLWKSLRQSIKREELGADFVAGVAAQMLKLSPDEAQKSIFLVGSPRPGELGSHGTAGDRAAAFRLGYFYQPPTDAISKKYSDFQNNRYAQFIN